eukprot:scaffold155501_cov32-Tisochrysis_lutea.AAC.1
MPPSLRTSLAGIPLECAVYNASGPKSGHVSDLVNVGHSRAGAVLSKSATLVKQSGNPLPRLRQIALGKGLAQGSINSEGLPNAGIDYYISQTVLDGVAQTGKPYIVSLSGEAQRPASRPVLVMQSDLTLCSPVRQVSKWRTMSRCLAASLLPPPHRQVQSPTTTTTRVVGRSNKWRWLD